MNIAHAYATSEPVATTSTMGETIVFGILFYVFLMGVAYVVCKITGEL